MRNRIYLDNNATTRVDPRVLEAMLPFFSNVYGNPAAGHEFGRQATVAVEESRASVARDLGAEFPDEIVFTSGATESVNLAIKGVAEANADRGDHIVTALSEHKAALNACRHLERKGLRVTWLSPDGDGLIDPEAVRKSITDRTVLVSIMAANNETGVLQDVASMGRICRERGVPFHTDATQAVGKLPFNARDANADMVSLSAHKIYGPKGVGALYVNRKARGRIAAQADGGGHEGGLRSGTVNTPGAVGMATALRLCADEMATESARIGRLRDRLQTGLMASIEHVRLNGHPRQRVPGTLNLSFAFAESESLLLLTPEIALSPGSACTSASREPSHVLKSMGIDDDLAHSAVRFSVGRFNTEEEIDLVIARVVESVFRLRSISPLNSTKRK